MAKSRFLKAVGISLAIIVALTSCDDVLSQLKDEIKLGQQTKQEELDFSLVLENIEPEARYSAVIYGTDGVAVAGAEGTPLADDGVVFAFLVLPGEYDLKITEKAGSVKTTKTDSVVFVDGLFKVVIGWDGLLEADAAEEAVEETDTEEEAVAEEPEAVEETDTEEEAVTEEPEAVEETDTEDEAVTEEPEAVEETDIEEEAVTEEPEAVEETDTEEEAAAEEPKEEPKDEPKAEEPEAVEETDTEEEAVEEKPEERPVFGIVLSETAITFPEAILGYGPQTAKTVTITNTGDRPTGALTVTLSGANASAFALTPASIDSIWVGDNATFTVAPKNALSPAAYAATVTVSGANGILKSFYIFFRVDAATAGKTPPTDGPGRFYLH
jgi:hypothetical protein